VKAKYLAAAISIISIAGCAIIGWLVLSHFFRRPHVLQLNEDGLVFSSETLIQCIAFERLKELPKFQADVESKTNAIWPLLVGHGEAATTEDAPCAQLVLRTPAGQRFAVQEFYPGDDFLLLMKDLSCGKRYWFVAGKARPTP
jgi:hypothetical protein